MVEAEISVPARSMTLTWVYTNGRYDSMTVMTMDPDDDAPKPHLQMKSWERTVLMAAMEKILGEMRALEIERG